MKIIVKFKLKFYRVSEIQLKISTYSTLRFRFQNDCNSDATDTQINSGYGSVALNRSIKRKDIRKGK